ncbi:hypothetical protein E0Z10_g3341 [Xylaria hypoxylon]|uniref:Uncharacterized protein n=1 Tax=Xylaria hypoxylon TaxID=37992 RepID=A0A4Z0ZA09_9PEZI|nr:hypothetical protein E0Z10_g3341 [Xylaria hypoxylon]
MAYSTESTPIPEIREDKHGTSPAYLLKWTNTEITKTYVHSAAQLRSCIQENNSSNRHLLVVRGLPVDHGVALKEVTDIDASFIEAHAGRRSYRSLRARTNAAWAYYDYPELVRQSSAPNDGTQRTATYDLVGHPPTYMISAAGDSIMLCRASIWLSEKAHILYLDRATWEDPESGVSRRRYKAYTAEKMPNENGVSTITMQVNANGDVTPLGDEIPSLETLLYDSLQDGCSGREDLTKLLEELAIRKWDDFFEALSLSLTMGSAETTALFLQALSCLERNLDVSRRRHKMRQRSIDTRPDTYALPDVKSQSSTTEWEALLSRLNRQVQVLSHLTPVVSNAEMPVRRPSAGTNADAGFGISSAGGHGEKHDWRSRNNYNTTTVTSSTLDENQRSLNRVAYLGGVLLPFSVVSGILSIEEPYGPSNSQFWIFWAVTAPLTLITLGVIYADSIRKAQVWVEVAASGKSDSDTNSDLESYSISGRILTDVEQAVPITGRMTEPVTVSLVEGASRVEVDEGEGGGGVSGEPDIMVEKRWKNASAIDANVEAEWTKKKKWRKEELGWAGACATMFQVYKLKKGVPPRHLRHSYKRDGLLGRARTN